MEKKKLEDKQIKEYWREVFWRTFTPIWDEMTMRIVIITFVFLLVITFVAGTFMIMGIVSTGFFGDRLGEARAGLGAAGFSLVVLIILILAGLYRVPAEMQSESNDKIKQLEEKLSKKTIDANIEIKLFPRQAKGYASLVIANEENEDVDTYTVSLLDVSRIDEDQSEKSITEKVNPDNAFISHGGGNSRAKIIRKSKATFNVAIQEGDKFFFLFDNGTRAIITEGLYKLEIGFDGNLDGKIINRITKTCYLQCFTKIVEVPVQDGNMTTKRGMYIDIREDKYSDKDIEPSSINDLPMDESIRYMAGRDRFRRER